MNENFDRFITEVHGKRVAVLGMGISNVPLIRLLLDSGANVRICDKKAPAQLDSKLLDEFSVSNASFSFGNNYLFDINNDDIIFRSPGINPNLPELISAKKHGVIITSEMQLFFNLCPCPIIGVTGSDGKTTTTTIIYELLKAGGINCHIGGNIGTPLIGRVNLIKPDDIVVLELSSFQLSDMTRSPQTAVITNVAPNHLDVHSSMEEYIDAKKNIYKHQKAGGRVILNWDNEITKEMAKDIANKVDFFSRTKRINNGFFFDNDIICKASNNNITEIIHRLDIKLTGLHNIENYLAAIAATDGLVKRGTIIRVAQSFNGVMHRLEFVRKLHGVSYYNDSIASSPTRTIAGLHSFDEKVILIAGGYDKNIPFDTLGIEINNHVEKLILVGETASKIKEAVLQSPNYDPDALNIFMYDTFDDAVTLATKISLPHDNVLLSPACASFDMFDNFEARGNRFKELVNSL